MRLSSRKAARPGERVELDDLAASFQAKVDQTMTIWDSDGGWRTAATALLNRGSTLMVWCVVKGVMVHLMCSFFGLLSFFFCFPLAAAASADLAFLFLFWASLSAFLASF
jgi:hypothetical protein